MEKLVSVIIPLYNREDYIEEAIRSILEQSYGNLEVIIIDDCSKDSSIEIVESIKDKRIKILKNEVNRGISYTRNKGFHVAKGDYVALLDSDDIAMPDRVKLQVDFLEKNLEVGIIGSNRLDFLDGKVVGTSKHMLKSSDLKISLLFDMPMTNPSLMLRKEVIKSYEYDKDYRVAEDYELIYRVARKWKIANIDKPLIKYRLHANQITKKIDDDIYLKKIKTRILRELDLKLEQENIEDTYYKGINLNVNQSEILEFCKIIIGILKSNEQKKIYDDKKLEKALLSRLERCIRRNLKGIEGIGIQNKIISILKKEKLYIPKKSFRIISNIIRSK